MSKTLSGFSSQNLHKDNLNAQTNSSNESIMEEYEKIKDLTQEEANKKLFEEVFKQKQEGTFDYNKLEKSIESLKPYLSAKDYENIQRILNSLK